MLQDKISRLRLVWNGEFFQSLNVYVDLVPAFESDLSELDDKSDDNLAKPPPLGVECRKMLLIPKISRHDEADHITSFHNSHSSTELAVIAALPLNVKHGLILAKAARIASIARPAEDLTSHYGLQEDIHVDDFITSYLLKTCLMKLLPRHSQSVECNCNDKFQQTEPTQECKWTTVERDGAGGWAIRIYEKLKTDLDNAKRIKTWYGKGTLMDCMFCAVERGCCQKRKLTLAMTTQILDWLKQWGDDLKLKPEDPTPHTIPACQTSVQS